MFYELKGTLTIKFREEDVEINEAVLFRPVFAPDSLLNYMPCDSSIKSPLAGQYSVII